MATATHSPPRRIQRRRTKGWRLPEGTVYVGRPTVFGNPWSVHIAREAEIFRPECLREIVVSEFRAWLQGERSPWSEHLGKWHTLHLRRFKLLERLPELRGKDLACWCPLDQPCHADILLELANA